MVLLDLSKDRRQPYEAGEPEAEKKADLVRAIEVKQRTLFSRRRVEGTVIHPVPVLTESLA